MSYIRINPPAYLRAYIRYAWILKSNSRTLAVHSFRIMADGCPGILFQQPEYGLFYHNGKPLPEFLLFGQSTRSAELSLCGSFRTIGISFYPNALKLLFGLHAEELTNTCLDLTLLSKGQERCLCEQLFALSNTRQQMEVLFAYLFSRIQQQSIRSDKAIDYALSAILQSKGMIELKSVQQQLQLSERSFERRFKEQTGISPKLFCRICCFQASLQQFKNQGYTRLSDIAFEQGYADQSHFIRSFKEFSGLSPKQYQQKTVEIAENLLVLT